MLALFVAKVHDYFFKSSVCTIEHVEYLVYRWLDDGLIQFATVVIVFLLVVVERLYSEGKTDQAIMVCYLIFIFLCLLASVDWHCKYWHHGDDEWNLFLCLYYDLDFNGWTKYHMNY